VYDFTLRRWIKSYGIRDRSKNEVRFKFLDIYTKLCMKNDWNKTRQQGVREKSGCPIILSHSIAFLRIWISGEQSEDRYDSRLRLSSTSECWNAMWYWKLFTLNPLAFALNMVLWQSDRNHLREPPMTPIDKHIEITKMRLFWLFEIQIF